MATATEFAYVRFTAAAIVGDDPMDAGMCSRSMGNLNHLADQYAQQRVNWVAPAGSSIVLGNSAPDDDVFYPVWFSTPFDLHVRSTGKSYPLRVRIKTKSGHAVQSASWRVVVAFQHDLLGASETVGAAYEATNADGVTHASTTSSWQTLKMLELDAAAVLRATQTVNTTDDLSEEAPAFWLRAVCAVYASEESGAAAELSGVNVCEYLI